MWWQKPGHLEDRHGQLWIGALPCAALAARYGTPLYVYNLDRVGQNFSRLRSALDAHLSDFRPEIRYAVKANPAAPILDTLRDVGAGTDVSSPAELIAALRAGFPKDRIVFTGTSLSKQDLAIAAGHEVLINVDAQSRLPVLAEVAKNRSILLRHNPLIGAGRTGGLITAAGHGAWPAKFGLPADELVAAARLAVDLGLDVVGVHQHIGSGWLRRDQLDRFFVATEATLALIQRLRGHDGRQPRILDLGGGLGVRRSAREEEFPLDVYVAGIADRLRATSVGIEQVIVEPGAFLVEDAGILLVSVTSVDRKAGHWLAGVDAGLNVFNGPAYYGDYNELVPVARLAAPELRRYSIVGNICEPRDVFGKRRAMPELLEGDVLAVLNAGAYGAVFACHYNGRPTPGEVFVRAGQVVGARKRTEAFRPDTPGCPE